MCPRVTVQMMGDLVYTGASDGCVRVWSVSRGRCEAELRVLPRRQVWCVMVVGRILLAGCSDGTIAGWDVQAKAALWTVHGPRDGVRRLAMTATRLFVCSGSGTISVFDWCPPTGFAAVGCPGALTGDAAAK